ncbi:hypothetical protein HYH03_007630 [Edaphochlamys debaryana]|uniref:Uncharacterized protein n=1 Tax=Edaphochlamys debaryana TaxID=47281 RepID=A0A836BZT1_9CHLO|nr:hypothetical protein HYH03_007630 [Edaphochlamys debaryana]|eukprot:KAG2494277.1 hypothetical protein HYH03_007630 [Edaphochlamys debaryana]
MAPIKLTENACRTSMDLDQAAWADARDSMVAYARASPQQLTMLADVMHFNNWTRAVVRGHAVMVVPLHQHGQHRRVLWFRELAEGEPSSSGLE